MYIWPQDFSSPEAKRKGNNFHNKQEIRSDNAIVLLHLAFVGTRLISCDINDCLLCVTFAVSMKYSKSSFMGKIISLAKGLKQTC